MLMFDDRWFLVCVWAFVNDSPWFRRQSLSLNVRFTSMADSACSRDPASLTPIQPRYWVIDVCHHACIFVDAEDVNFGPCVCTESS